ncbi:alpha/beta hydrolase [Microbacteriaceae bacterium VKM Ac-2855]|nr:alpha/beta hydrolase [Microbacteriaceae bacterium VKM Ac-2855]
MTVASPYSADLAGLPTTRAEVPLAGGMTAYWCYGSADAATTVVMVHGFRGDHHGLEPVVARLLAGGADARVIAPDLPGFGDSTPMTLHAHDIAGYGAWLRLFLAELDLLGTAVVLGHSFGSIVVAGAAASGLPAPLLILVNPIAAPALAGPRGVMTRLAVFYYWLGARLPRALGFGILRNRAIVRIMSLTMAKTSDKALLRFIHDQHDRYFSAFATRETVLESFRASVSHDVSEFAADIAIPTMLIAADRDDITPVAAQYELVQRFPHARLHVISGVGHLIHYETPDEAAKVIRGAVEKGIDA